MRTKRSKIKLITRANSFASGIDLVILAIWTYIVFIIPSLLLSSALYFFSSNYFNSAQEISNTPDLYFLINLFLFLPGVGIFLNILNKKALFIGIWRLKKEDAFTYLGLAGLVSFFSWRMLSILRSWQYPGLLVLFIFYIFYLPQTIQFLGSIELGTFYKLFGLNLKRRKRYVPFVKKILVFIGLLILIHFTVTIVYKVVNVYQSRQTYLSRYPRIINITPKIVYYANKVILTGYEFGWKGTINTEFKYQKGIISIDLWTDTKVIFTVPLHWKLGDIIIWIEKPVEWNGKTTIVKSNKIKLRLISRDNGWDVDDDAYFEQLKHLDKETLQLNGYQ